MPLTVVMYHFVRDPAVTRYPELKVRTIETFEGQLDYVTKHYEVLRVADVVAACRGERGLPPNACLLTFDDGLLDHYTVVFPRLVARGLPASFYPPAAAVEERRVLDTHKIQLILAAAGDVGDVTRRMIDLIDGFRASRELPSVAVLRERYAHPFWLDRPEVVFVKRVLQRGLPDPVRSAVIQALFEEYVGVPERTVAGELYLDVEQLGCMLRHGMEVGGHGADHLWLETLSAAAQAREIERTVRLLTRIHGHAPVEWAMSYPFGSYDDATLALLTEACCAVAMTTRVVGIAPDLGSPLTLPRLDTNELPTRGDAPLARWTLEVRADGSRHG